MINLLPSAEKVKLVRTYRMRVIAVFLILCAAAFAIGSVFLVPSFQAAQDKTAEMKKNIEIAKALSAARLEGNPEFVMKEVEKKLDLFAAQKSRLTFSEIISAIVSDRPAGVQIFGFTYDASGTGKMEVRGKASDRDTLLRFVGTLEKKPAFEKVAVPVSQFVKESDLDFTMSITMRAKKP